MTTLGALVGTIRGMAVRARLFALAAVVLVGFTVLVTLALTEIAEVRIGGPIDQEIRYDRQRIQELTQLRTDLADMRVLATIARYTTDVQELKALQRAHATLALTVDREFGGVVAGETNEEIRFALTSARSTWADFAKTTREILRAGMLGTAPLEPVLEMQALRVERFTDQVDAAVHAITLNSDELGARAQANAARRVRIVLLGSIALGIAVLVVTVLIARSIGTPLRRLLRACEQVAAGDLHARADLTRRDEFGHLARAFDTMMSELDRSTAALREAEATSRTAHAESRAHEKRLSAMIDVVRTMSQTLDERQVFDTIVAAAADVFEAQSGLRIVDGDDLVRVAATEDAVRFMRSERIQVGESITGHVVVSGEPFVTSDIASEPIVIERHRHGLGSTAPSLLCVPIRRGTRAIGTLNIYREHGHQFDERAVGIASAFADHAAIAIENSRLHAAAMKESENLGVKTRELEALLHVATALTSTLDVKALLKSVAQRSAQALGVDRCSVSLFRDGKVVSVMSQFADGRRDEGQWRKYKSRTPQRIEDNSLLGSAIAERAPVIVEDAANDSRVPRDWVENFGIRSAVVVPLIRRDAVIGTLTFDHTDRLRRFEPENIRLATTIAAQVALAIDNASLYRESRRHQDQLGQIFDSTSDSILLIDAHRRVLRANRRAEEILGVESGVAAGSDLEVLLRAVDDATSADRLLAFVTDGAAPRATGELCVAGQRVLEWTGQRVGDLGNEGTTFTLTLHDVTEDRRISQMRADFVSFATHQLRTPLSGVKWLLELTSQDRDLPDEARSYVEDARAAAERLIGMVNDLLDISRLEGGRLNVTIADVPLADVTRSVLDELSPLARAKSQRVSIEAPARPMVVRGDAQLLRQVVMNLASNAIKYTPDGGDVAVRMSAEGDHARWEIRDTGIGIPASSRDKLFEKFYRADNADILNTEGTGLGLYLVRLVLDRPGGRVWCESVEGRGTTFFFTIPLTREHVWDRSENASFSSKTTVS